MRHLFLLPLVLAFPLFGAFPDICERCWYEVPHSNLDTVAQTPKPPGWSYFRETMGYNGGAFDTRRNRLLVALGGFTSYAGNELYAFDVDSLKWFRIKNGSTYYDKDDTLYAYYKNGGAVPDSQQPRPGYTFDEIEYDSTSDNLHVFGVPFAYKNGTTWTNIHRLNLSTLNWSYGGDIGHDIYGGSVSARDPATGKIWFLGNGTTSWMSSYSPGTGVLADHGDAWSGDGIASYQTGAIMPPKNRFISIGGGAANFWNLVTSGNTDRQTLATTGCDSLKAIHGPGFEWSPVENKMVGWAGGTSVYTMDTSFTCSEVPANVSNTVTPSSPSRYGTFGRWRYIPKYNVFMVVNSTNGNVYFYRHSAYNPSAAKDTVVITSPASGFLTNQGSVPVAWTVNGVHQNTGLVEVLEEEGPNPIIRCAGSACDTVMVSRDTQAPVVVITQPKGGDTVLATKAIVHFTLDGAVQIPDTVALAAGWNTVRILRTDAAGNIGRDSISLFHPVAPVVIITSPAENTYTNQTSISVAWTVDGVPRTPVLMNLASDGRHTLFRADTNAFGLIGIDSVHVYRDRVAPALALVSPAEGALILQPTVNFEWTVDGVAQTPLPHAMDTSRANHVLLKNTDLAGNADSLLVTVYPGTLVPAVEGMNLAVAESVLVDRALLPMGTWVDNDTLPTGVVFAQTPKGGDSLQYHHPVRFSVSRGLDAVDLVPIALSVDSMKVSPNTLAASGSVRVEAVNLGRAEVSDSFAIVVFEDRNLDGKYAEDADLRLGRAVHSLPLSVGDTLDLAIPVSGSLNFNGNRISVVLDPDDRIAETREDNNATHSMAACTKRPPVMDYVPRLKWEWRDSLDAYTGIFVTPMVINMNDDNGDGRIDADDMPDVVTATNSNSLTIGYTMAVDGRTGRLLWKAPVNHFGLSDLAAGDVDGDGKPEVVNIQCGPYCWERRLVVVDNEGEVKSTGEWRTFNSISFVPDAISLSDLDGDGKAEIIWGHNVHDHAARLVYPKVFDKDISVWSAVDLDADGYQELVGASRVTGDLNSRLGIFDYKEKRILRRSPIYYAPQYNLIGRVENDSGPRFIHNTQYYKDTAVAAELYDMRLNRIAKYPGVLLQSNPPGQYDGNLLYRQYPHYFGTDSTRMLLVIGSNQAHIPGTGSADIQPFFSRLSLRDSSTAYRIFPQTGKQATGAVFDFNDDGIPEAVLIAQDTLYILDADGNTLGQKAMPMGAQGWKVSMADVDKDGKADIVVGLSNPRSGTPGMMVFSNPTWVGARGIYNQLDYTVTNVDDDGRIPRFPTPHWEANNSANVQCAMGNYACVDISASFPQITLDSANREQATARIGNGGAMELPAGIPVTVYATHQGIESRLTTLFTPTRLKPGQFYTAKAPLPEDMRGSYSFRYAADDSGNGHGNLDESNETNNTVAFTFLLNNQAPAVTQPANQYAEPGRAFDFQVEAIDADGDTLSYALTRGPAGMSLNPLTGAIHWIPSRNPPRCTVEVVVSDPYQGRSRISFLVYVGNLTNLPPVLSSTPGITAALNTLTSQTVSTYSYVLEASDPESEAPLEYELTCLNCEGATGTTPGLEGNVILWRPFQPMWMPGDSVQLSLRAIDARGGITTQAWTIRLYRNSNAAPGFASSPNTSATEDAPWRSPVTVFDLDGDEVTLLLDTVPLGMSVSQDSLRWTPATPGSYVVRIGATDGMDTTWQRFVLAVAPVNDAPRIVSAAPTGAISGALYSYSAIATDEDGDALTYSLAQAPAGMTVSPQGEIQWRSPRIQTAPVSVELVVRDPSSAVARQSWIIGMFPDTVAPGVHIRFSGNPARLGNPVTVTVEAGDNVEVTDLTLTLDGSAVALTQGQYVFTPSAVGTRVFQASATDPSSNTGTFLGSLRVSHAAEWTPPEVSIHHSPLSPQAGQTVTFMVAAADTDGVDESRLWVDVDGASIPVRNGQAQYLALRPGDLIARAVAFDSLGASALASVSFAVSPQGGDATAPTALITSPSEDRVVCGRMALVGTASDANLAYYTLSFRDINSSVWTEYARATENVVEDSLGFIDGTSLSNGDYEIRLDVHDRSGNHATRSVQVTVAGEKKIGAFTLAFEDLSIPMSGMDLAITRAYDSRFKSSGDFGMGWRMGMRSITLHENRNQGEDWEIQRSAGLIPQYSIAGAKSHGVTVTLPGGRKQEFTPKPRFFSAFNPTYGVMEYEAKPGTYSRLESVEADTFLVMGGKFYDERGDLEEPFNPSRYKLTLLDGSYFVYDQVQGGVVESGDPNGNVLQWEANVIRHNAGNDISFSRDSVGRITSISDRQGRGMQYRYDVLGNLQEVLDANGNSTRFRYRPNHYLDEVIDARGIRAARTEYDADGRMIRQINSHGDTLKLHHDLPANTETIEDFAGRVTTYTYDDRGHVLTKTDARGGTWAYAHDSVGNLLQTTHPDGATSASTYDSQGNELTSTDELGNTTTRTFDAEGHVLAVTDPLSRVTRYEYDARGNLVKETGPGGIVKSERAYDDRGNVLSEKDALGHVTEHTYNAFGWLTSTTDAEGRVTLFYHDNAGRVTREIDAAGNSTRHAYDAKGNRIRTINALGDTVRTVYNAIDKVLLETDALGHATRHEYNALGDKVRDISPDGATLEREYDAAGNVSALLDPLGRRTEMEYDHENRLLKTTFAGGSSTRNTYDARGRRVLTLDANGHATTYGYDAAGRDTSVTDALGHRTRYAYDAAGRKTAMVDALGRRTEYAYDAYDRLTTTTFADNSTRFTAYDLAGRKISETDPEGKVTGFEYDDVGNLTAVVDALGHRTEYAYDARDNRISQKDADNHVTTMEYDALNRMVRKEYPNGDEERWTYNANGQATSHVKGTDSTAYQFDAMDREVFREHFPSGHEVRTTYTADGKRDTVVDYRGTTTYAYDSRGRLHKETQANGDTLVHDYDAQGNRIRLRTPFGETRYGYDALNRMDSVTSPRNQVTAYHYNPVGNLDSVVHANGTRVGYSHDLLNRLTEVRNWGSAGTLVSRHTYLLNDAGIRTQVTELDGSVVTYAHDDLYRLTGETRTGSHPYVRAHGYDNVGNRLFQVKDGDTTAYAYNSRDQLTLEESSGNSIEYGYDAAGRMTSKAAAAGVTRYFWVDNDRLDSISGPGVAVGYGYDAEGRRVKESTPTSVRQFLVDGLLPYGQVILETDGAGDLVTEYVYGLERVSQERGGVSHWFLADGQGSVRQLADSNGFVSDTYAYTAFGEPLASSGSTANDFRYVGEQRDGNSGLYYLRARWMDPTTGRFASVDPYQGRVGKPISQHRYLYADQSPLSKSDPTGRMAALDALFSTGIQSTIRVSQINVGASIAMSLYTLMLVYQTAGNQEAMKEMEALGFDKQAMRAWLADARSESPIRLRHYTTERGKSAISITGVINNPTGNGNFFTPDPYSSSEEATDKLATKNEMEFYLELNLYRKADVLTGPRPVDPHTYITADDIRIRGGGGTEYSTFKPIWIEGLMRARSNWIPLTE